MLAAVRRVLSADESIEIVGEAHSGEQVLPLALETQPDVVLLDIGMPGVDGIACARRIRERVPSARVVMLTAYDDPGSVRAAVEAGARGYILKSVASVDFADAVRRAGAGGEFELVGFPDEQEAGRAKADLSDRELSVLSGVHRGLTNREIGGELWVTEQTVKFHLRNIYRKLDAANRTEAVRRAYELGVLRLPESRLSHVPS